MRRGSAVLAAGIMASVLLSTPARAKPAFLNHLRQTYGLGDAAKCTICHDVKRGEKPGKKNLGAFGKDYQSALQKRGKDNLNAVLKDIADMDSDGDGATNIEEIRLGTLPGDSSSVPAKEMLEKYRKFAAANAPKK
jgi:hypothetical protein